MWNAVNFRASLCHWYMLEYHGISECPLRMRIRRDSSWNHVLVEMPPLEFEATLDEMGCVSAVKSALG